MGEGQGQEGADIAAFAEQNTYRVPAEENHFEAMLPPPLPPFAPFAPCCCCRC
jgi:hypothetical protein